MRKRVLFLLVAIVALGACSSGLPTEPSEGPTVPIPGPPSPEDYPTPPKP